MKIINKALLCFKSIAVVDVRVSQMPTPKKKKKKEYDSLLLLDCKFIETISG